MISSVYYGKEPFDLRLTVLRMLRNLHVIVGVTVLGTLLFGGGYYVKNVLLNNNTTYEVTSTYKVSYVDEPSKSGDYYINEMTWNTYVDSKEFLDTVLEHLHENTIMYDSVYVTSAEELAAIIDAKLASDVHVPSTIVTTDSANWTVLIAAAVEETMVEEFTESNEQVAAIEVIDPAVTAEEVVPDVRPARAVLLSAILSFFFVVVILLLKEISDDAIWLPVTLRRRYGIPVVGTINSPELKANLEYLFADKMQIAVCTVNDRINPTEVVAALKEKLEWVAIPTPIRCPEACDAMRKADGVLLVVKAGRCAGKNMEYNLAYLETQGIDVTAVLLYDADEWLIRTYYMLPVTASDVTASKRK